MPFKLPVNKINISHPIPSTILTSKERAHIFNSPLHPSTPPSINHTITHVPRASRLREVGRGLPHWVKKDGVLADTPQLSSTIFYIYYNSQTRGPFLGHSDSGDHCQGDRACGGGRTVLCHNGQFGVIRRGGGEVMVKLAVMAELVFCSSGHHDGSDGHVG